MERLREVKLRDLKIPDQAIENSARRAKEAFNNLAPGGEKARSLDTSGMLALAPRQRGEGSVVAFYACLPYEKAPELPRPAGEAPVKKNFYGLLSYTLTGILETQLKNKTTYRELMQALLAKYQAERGDRGPTPFAEGDLDREVLGSAVWPKRSQMILERKDDTLRVSGIGVFRLTRDSILAIHPAANDPRDFKDVLGHVKVRKLTPFHAEVEPCAYQTMPAVQAEKLPAGAAAR